MKKVIITGVSGQTGSYMVDYLLKKTDCEIIGVVRRLSVPNHGNIGHLLNEERFRIAVADVTDKTSITNIISQEKPDYFINFAANSFVGNSWEMPYNHVETNFIGVLHQLEAIKNFCPHCRYYNAGSSEEFGNVNYSPQDEYHPLKPRSPYAVSKVAARQMVKVYRESYNLYAIQGYLMNHESERRGIEFISQKIAHGLAKIDLAIQNRKRFEPLELGNLEAKRDWSHVLDFVDGIWRMLNQEIYSEKLGMDYETMKEVYDEKRATQWLSQFVKEYVLASGETHSVRDFINEAIKYTGIIGAWQTAFEKENETFESPRGTIIKINPKFYRLAEVDVLCGNASSAKQELGWEPQIDFDELVKRMMKNQISCQKKIS